MSRALGLDPGTRRIGVAVSNSARTMAFPRESIPAGEGALESVRRLVDDEGATTVVVGRPVSLAGRETSSTVVADELREEIARVLEGVEVVAADERLTTASAQRRLADAGLTSRDQRGRVDSAAAVVLLQAYLDACAH
jgi:putative Holliday junction resolvase